MSDPNAWKQDAEGYFIEMDLGEKKDYSIDWTDWLGTGGHTPTAVDWTIPAEVSLISQNLAGNVSQVVLSVAGAAGVFACSVKMTTDAPQLIEILPFRIVVK